MNSLERHQTHAKFPVDAEHLHRYAFASEITSNRHVLDVACGTGYGTNILANTAASVTGVDIDEVSIQSAKNIYKKKNINFRRGDILSIPATDNEFDVVVSFETLEHVLDHERAITEIKRVLKPGGVLILSTPNKLEYSDKPKYQNPFHVKELYQRELQALLSKFFKNVEWFYQRFYHASIIQGLNSGTAPLLYSSNSKNQVINNSFEDLSVFFVTVCSDEKWQLPNSSVFDISNAVIKNHKTEVDALYNSTSYRIGNFIVRAASLFKKK